MSIQCLYRAQCQPCERYLPRADWAPTTYPVVSVTEDTRLADLFIDFASAYDEAVRRGWSAHPLLCPDCAADLVRKVKERDDGEVRRDDPSAQGDGALRQLEEGP